MKKAFPLCILFLMATLFADIPEYQISSIQKYTITLSNNAVIQGSSLNALILQEWQPGDFIELASINTPGFISAPKKIEDGVLLLPSMLMFNNVTQNNAAMGWMEDPPSYPNPGVFLIADIDLVSRLVQLNDATVWTFRQKDVSWVEHWDVGDIIMIGKNGPYSLTPNYDSILFNARLQRVLQVMEL